MGLAEILSLENLSHGKFKRGWPKINGKNAILIQHKVKAEAKNHGLMSGNERP